MNWYDLFLGNSMTGGNQANVAVSLDTSINWTLVGQRDNPTGGAGGTGVQVKFGWAGSQALVWTGTTTNYWRAASAPDLNWVGSAVYYNLDAPLFDDTALAANTTVSLDGALHPASVVVDGTNSYTFTDDFAINAGTLTTASKGSIGGIGTTLTKSGSGTLTISNTNPNNFTGDVSITGGGVVLKQYSGLGVDNVVTVDGAGTTLVSTTSFLGQDSSKSLIMTNGAGWHDQWPGCRRSTMGQPRSSGVESHRFKLEGRRRNPNRLA